MALFAPMKNSGAKTERGTVSRLIEKIQASGIELSHLTLMVTPGNRASIEILYDGERIGSGELQDQRRGVRSNAIYVREIQVNYSFANRGLGTLIYLILAREAQKSGLQLESSWDPTPDDKATWKGMVERGWAKQIDSLFFEMNHTFMDDATTKSSIDSIVQTLSSPI